MLPIAAPQGLEQSLTCLGVHLLSALRNVDRSLSTHEGSGQNSTGHTFGSLTCLKAWTPNRCPELALKFALRQEAQTAPGCCSGLGWIFPWSCFSSSGPRLFPISG